MPAASEIVRVCGHARATSLPARTRPRVRTLAQSPYSAPRAPLLVPLLSCQARAAQSDNRRLREPPVPAGSMFLLGQHAQPEQGATGGNALPYIVARQEHGARLS
jgi:hypothetical protein